MADLEEKLNGLLTLLESRKGAAQCDREFCQGLIDLFEAEYASVFDCWPEKQVLKFRCAPNLKPEEIKRHEIRFGEGVCGAAALTGRTLAVYDASQSPQHYSEVDRGSGLVTRSLLAAPAIHRGTCLAVIEVMNRRTGHFSEYEKVLARCLATLYAARLAQLKQVKRPPAGAIGMADDPADCVMVGAGMAMDQVLNLILKTAPTSLPVLIQGETGTGKELVAHRIHQASQRRTKPLVTINCAALSETILESELFGHVKGAFTGADRNRVGRLEEADRGTVFLDEIGDMSLACQAKLLRAIENGEIVPVGGNQTRRINVRLIAATHQSLQEMVRERKFRADLFFRIKGIEIVLPPLRERKGDIELLARFFIEQLNRETGRSIRGFTPEALAVLNQYCWPGNIRELRHAIACAHSLAEREWLTPAELPRTLFQARQDPSVPAQASERDRILQALSETAYPGSGRWNIARAAKRLGLARKTLDYQIRMVLRLDGDRDGGGTVDIK